MGAKSDNIDFEDDIKIVEWEGKCLLAPTNE